MDRHRLRQPGAHTPVRRALNDHCPNRPVLPAVNAMVVDSLDETRGDGEVSRGGLPTGTLTVLFTDVEGSTELWNRDVAASSLGERDVSPGRKVLIGSRSVAQTPVVCAPCDTVAGGCEFAETAGAGSYED